MNKKTSLKIDIINFDFEGLEQEAIVAYPEKTPAPGVIFIHGHQGNAYNSLLAGRKLLEQGYAVFLPSMLGYGYSEGKPDYCGPKTIGAIYEGAKIFFEDPKVDKSKIAIYGVSRGAMTASQIITQNKFHFAAAVLEAGAYDFETFYTDPKTPEEIKYKLYKETGATNEELKNRSAIRSAENIDCPVLLLHGSVDDRVSVEQAKTFAQELEKYNKKYQLTIIEGAGHRLARKNRYEYVFSFLKDYLSFI